MLDFTIANSIFSIDKIEDINSDFLSVFFKEERHESKFLEFKSFSRKGNEKLENKKKGVLTSICAFANSEGGVLIWGAPEEKKIGGNFKVCSGKLTKIDIMDKDAVVSMITSSISPIITGIYVHPVSFEDGFIFLIIVPKSNYAPHQYKGTYYLRMDGQNIIAPHRYVEALMKQVKYPNVGGYLKVVSGTTGQHFYNLRLKFLYYNYSKSINGENLMSTIWSPSATFQEVKRPILDKTIDYSKGNRTRVRKYVTELIYYGVFEEESTVIEVPNVLFKEGVQEIDIIVRWATKDSPLKQSIYKIQVTNANLKYDKNCFVEMNENQLVSDLFIVEDHKMIEDKLGREINMLD